MRKALGIYLIKASAGAYYAGAAVDTGTGEVTLLGFDGRKERLSARQWEKTPKTPFGTTSTVAHAV